MENSENMSTPSHMNTKPRFQDVLTTPVGDNDKKPKIQLCLELRRKEISSARKSKNTKNTEQIVLEVTVMWVKHLPQNGGKRPNPFVKLRLLPEDEMQITELHEGKNDAQYIEVFSFPLNKTKNLANSLLEVQVCDNKATRNAKQFGNVSISLTNLKKGQPSCEWHYLQGGDKDANVIKVMKVTKNDNISTPKSKPETKQKKEIHPPDNMQNDESADQVNDKDNEQSEDEGMKENIANLEGLKIHKSKGKRNKALVIHSDEDD